MSTTRAIQSRLASPCDTNDSIEASFQLDSISQDLLNASTCLYSGGKRSVYRYELKNFTVALKVINYCQGEDSDLAVKRNIDNCEKEKNNLIKFTNHPTVNFPVSKLIGYLNSKPNYYLALEYFPNGDLFQYITDQWGQKADFNKTYTLIKKITYALNILHENDVIHGDLKPANIMLDKNNEIKFIDFSLTKFKDDAEEKFISFGTPGYIAPEIWKSSPINQASDVYSLGIVIWELTHQTIMFHSLETNQLIQKNMAGQIGTIKPDTPEKLKQLIIWCCMFNPKQRPTTKQLLIEMEADLNSHSPQASRVNT